MAVIALVAMASTSAMAAKKDCPPMPSDVEYPWEITDLMHGDQYADVFIEIDKKGRPVRCLLGKSNIDAEIRYSVCKAFMNEWTAPPPTELDAHNHATVERRFLVRGEKHRKAESDTKKEYFRLHPDQRPECYPGNDH